MGDRDDVQHPLSQSDPAFSLTSGLTPSQSLIPVLSADTVQAVADAAPRPVTAAVSKVGVPDRVEKSQGSFAALNKMLHSFTSGSPKALKKEIKKGSALTDAQVQNCRCMLFGYATHAADLVTPLAASPMQQRMQLKTLGNTLYPSSCSCLLCQSARATLHAVLNSTSQLHNRMCSVQIADICYTSKEDFAGSALHILHRGTNYIVYIATARETGLKLLLKAYDMSEQPFQSVTCPDAAHVLALTGLCQIVLARLCSYLHMWCNEHQFPQLRCGALADMPLFLVQARNGVMQTVIAHELVIHHSSVWISQPLSIYIIIHLHYYPYTLLD